MYFDHAPKHMIHYQSNIDKIWKSLVGDTPTATILKRNTCIYLLLSINDLDQTMWDL